jgi:hypothetical protein
MPPRKKETGMGHSAPSFRPDVDNLEQKQLLSALHVPQHVDAAHRHRLHSQQTAYYYYLNVQNNTGGTIGSGAIRWRLVGQTGQTLYQGSINRSLTNGSYSQLVSGPSGDSLGDTFTISYNGQNHTRIQASSSSTGEPAYVPTFYLSASATRLPRGCHGNR